MRDELLNGETFRTITEARVVITAWLRQYNTFRPHRALGMKTPAGFAVAAAAQARASQ
jgi:transposase InsO family protein